LSNHVDGETARKAQAIILAINRLYNDETLIQKKNMKIKQYTTTQVVAGGGVDVSLF